MFGEFMATFFANLMPLILVIWAISYQTFVTEINTAFRKEFWEAHKADEALDGNDLLDNFDYSGGGQNTTVTYSETTVTITETDA